MLLFKGGVLIYAEHCIYIYIYIYKCSQTTRHVWIWTENDRNSRVASATREPLGYKNKINILGEKSCSSTLYLKGGRSQRKKVYRHPLHPTPRRKTSRASCLVFLELVWFCLQFPWSQPLVRLSESRACTMRTLVKAPSSENPPKAKHTQWQMLSYCEQSASSGADSACFAPKQTTHKLCVSPPIKKRGREEHTAYVCLHSYNEK